MKSCMWITAAGLLLAGTSQGWAAAPELSRGTYRIGFEDGTAVFVGNDHLTHSPPTRIDMNGFGGRGPYRVVAAADGYIRAIVDTNFLTCSSCASSNNYV